MTSPTAISVVLSTYNRGALLEDAIRSLLALDPASPPHEVIVVDNNSTDHTRAVVEGLIPESEGRLRYVFEARQGLSYARNAGISVSQYPIVAFTDDDVRASPDWLIALERAFAEHPDADFVGGRVAPLWPAPPPDWLTHRSHSSPLALLDYGVTGKYLTASNFVCLVGANLAVRRRLFYDVGCFDPRFQHQPGAVTACEDHDFQARVVRSGRKGWYEPAALIRAEVPARRLTKAYHRKWHFDHGAMIVRMTPPGCVLDAQSAVVPMSPGSREFMGVPLYLVRGVGKALVRAAWSALRRDDEKAFWWIGRCYEYLGEINYYARVRARGVDRGLHDVLAPALERATSATEHSGISTALR